MLVVIGHTCYSDGILARIIYTVHLPLFFIISGYLFDFTRYEYNFDNFLKKKFNRLVLPYITCAIILYFFLLTTIGPYLLKKPSLGAIICITRLYFVAHLFGIGAVNVNHVFSVIPHIGELWFLVCLFFAELIFWTILSWTKNIKGHYQFLIFGILTYIGAFIGQHIFLPYSIDIALVAQIFLFCGYKAKKINFLEKINNWKIIVLFLVIWVIDILNGGLSMNNREYNNILFSTSGAIAASLLIIYITYLLSLRYKTFCKIFSYLGIESIIILSVHTHILNLIPSKSLLNYYWPIKAAFIIGLSLAIGLIIKKIPLLNTIFYGKTKAISQSIG